MIKSHILLFLGILILPNLVFSADDALEFKVKLDIRCDESIASRIKTTLSEELRALDDVTLSKDNYSYDITVIGGKLKNTGGDNVGVVLSVIILTKFENQHFSYMFKDQFVKEGITLTNGLYYYPKHWIRSGSIHDLKSICRRIIADFDGQILQKQRDGSEKFFDLSN